ncbi:MAG TPA: hypothetical protein VGB23_07630 [Nitrospirota bacterium]
MKWSAAFLVGVLFFSYYMAAHAGTFESVDGFSCDQPGASPWTYEAYRAEDGAYLPMIFGRAPITELSRYGMEARYLPDGGQPYYPYISRFPDGLRGSPATSGRRFDAVTCWSAPAASKVRVTGFVELMGNIKWEAAGKRIRARLLKGKEVLWDKEVEGAAREEFSVDTDVAAGDKVRLHLENMDGTGGKLTLFDVSIDNL